MTILCEKSHPSLLIADDHALFLDALRPLLEKSYVVIGSVTDGRALVAEATRLKPEVIIVDIGMPLLNGFDAACRIREQLPERSHRVPDNAGRSQPGSRGDGVGKGRFRSEALGSKGVADGDRARVARKVIHLSETTVGGLGGTTLPSRPIL